MKTTTVGLFAALFFTFASATALADDRDHRFGGVRGGDSWRLGERVRGGYAIYHRGYRVPGAAIAIADGWVLGSGRESGGYAIYRWNGRAWDQAPGGAVKIGGSYRQPWVINNRGQRFIWNGYDWDVDYRRAYGNSFGRDWGRERSYDRHQNRDRYSFQRGFLGKERHERRDHHDRFREDRDRSERRRTRW